jgi:hypothetical protein
MRKLILACLALAFIAGGSFGCHASAGIGDTASTGGAR